MKAPRLAAAPLFSTSRRLHWPALIHLSTVATSTGDSSRRRPASLHATFVGCKDGQRLARNHPISLTLLGTNACACITVRRRGRRRDSRRDAAATEPARLRPGCKGRRSAGGSVLQLHGAGVSGSAS